MPIIFGTYGALSTVKLENSSIRAVILPSKGADLLELIDKRNDLNLLYRSDLPIQAYDALDLSKQRLSYHSDQMLGGYMDLLPHRGFYKGEILEQEAGGIAATLPWNMEVISDTEEKMHIKCFVHLPIFPLYVERSYILYSDSHTLRIEEYVKNTGDECMLFTWTQHALFGGKLLSEDAFIEVSTNKLFKPWEQIKFPDQPLTDFVSDIKNAVLKQGICDVTRPPDKNCVDYEFVVFINLLEGKVSIVNQDLKLRLNFRWDQEVFPYLRTVMRYESKGAMMGLEPSNDMFSDWNESANNHTYTCLDAGEEVNTWFELDVIQCSDFT